MIQNNTISGNVAADDASLVDACLNGEREAFAQIVRRYQSLVASIAYSQTGSIAQSEDLAQETFLAAWRGLKTLEEPCKLKSWLCGIARRATANARRRWQREPVETSEPLEMLAEPSAQGAMPLEHAINREEEAILWRSLEEIPATYREPLILFYREGQGVERVAEAMEISPEAVRQRLSRGRKMLEERVVGFVEGALRRSAPGQSFTAAVMAAIPAQFAGVGLASMSATAAKSGAAVKAAGLAGLSCLAGFLPGLVGGYQGYKFDMERATSAQERKGVRRFYVGMAVCTLLPLVLIMVAMRLKDFAVTHETLYAVFVAAIGFSWLPCAAVLLKLLCQRASGMGTQADDRKPVPLLEWRTKATFLGLPLVHLRHGGRAIEAKRPVKAWIAVGDVAYGGLFACGGVAIAPICFGGLGVGILVFGGFAAGIVTYCGFGLGVWALGGCVTAWNAIGGCAVAWNAALGGLTLAREYAVGGMAIAAHANDTVAQRYMEGTAFFRNGLSLVTKWLWPTMAVATIPSFLISMGLRRRARQARAQQEAAARVG